MNQMQKQCGMVISLLHVGMVLISQFSKGFHNVSSFNGGKMEGLETNRPGPGINTGTICQISGMPLTFSDLL